MHTFGRLAHLPIQWKWWFYRDFHDSIGFSLKKYFPEKYFRKKSNRHKNAFGNRKNLPTVFPNYREDRPPAFAASLENFKSPKRNSKFDGRLAQLRSNEKQQKYDENHSKVRKTRKSNENPIGFWYRFWCILGSILMTFCSILEDFGGTASPSNFSIVFGMIFKIFRWI